MIRRATLLAGFSFLLWTGCASNPGRPAISKCFRLIIDNNLPEFKRHVAECKNDRNAQGLTSLMMAIAKDNNDIAEYLIEQKTDIEAADNAGITALTFAANKNNARLAQILRRAGARIEIRDQNLSPLMMAVRNSSLELIRVLQATPPELNLRAEDGWTAIYFAVSRQDEDILNFLLDQGACIQMKDHYQQRPIDFAREIKWKEGVKLLSRKTAC